MLRFGTVGRALLCLLSVTACYSHRVESATTIPVRLVAKQGFEVRQPERASGRPAARCLVYRADARIEAIHGDTLLLQSIRVLRAAPTGRDCLDSGPSSVIRTDLQPLMLQRPRISPGRTLVSAILIAPGILILVAVVLCGGTCPMT